MPITLYMFYINKICRAHSNSLAYGSNSSSSIVLAHIRIEIKWIYRYENSQVVRYTIEIIYREEKDEEATKYKIQKKNIH